MKTLLVTFALLVAIVLPAAAVNLVGNGGFETPVTGVEFTQYYNLGQQNTYSVGAWWFNGNGNTGGYGALGAILASNTASWGPMYNPEGNQLFWLRSQTSGGTELSFPILQQSLATTAGQQYTIRFAIDSFRYSAGGAGQVRVMLGDLSEIFTATAPSSEGGWQYFERTITASGNDALKIERMANDPLLDDISVTAAAVPEPSSLIMLISGLAGIGSVIRRRK